MHPLVGYCDRWSVKPGETIRFMVSSRDDTEFSLRFARHICADPNPDGPGYREIPMATPLEGRRPGLFQPAFLGSFGRADLAVSVSPGFAIAATIWPTTPGKGEQGVVSLMGADWSLALGIGPGGGAMARLVSPVGVQQAEVPAAMLTRRWYDIALAIDADGRLRVVQRPRRPVGRVVDAGEAACGEVAAPGAAGAVLLAALPADGAGPASHYFNGKLERPTLWRLASPAEALDRQAVRDGDAAPDRVACWDFSIGVDGVVARDIGPHTAHAALVNLPTRAMTGSNWTGAVHDWKAAPEQYGAIHFHDDDQGDLGWRKSFSLDVPKDWPSGFYSAHIRNAHGEDRIPFFVRPAAPSARVAVLVPTFSYQAYGCYFRPGRGKEIAERAAAWGALTETPDMNPEFGLSTYNYHADGSGVSITTMRRPMLDTRPRQISLMDPAPGGSGTGRICADSYVIDWLTHLGIDHDVITDHDLHAEGTALLAPYRVVIAVQHPEYHSERMLQGLEAYLAGGGRLMYLGGNGFYWRAEPSESAPHALEVRRAEGGIRVWATEVGENYHAFGGGYGGLWRRIGRPAHALVGNGFSAQGRHLGFPYHFTESIADPRVAFMREGMDVAAGQVFGDSGFMGGGASGFELDSADPKYGTPPNALVVAKGVVIHPDYGPVNEDMLVIRHPRPQEDWSCADMVFFETSAGGAVFSVGSMTYVGSLGANGYDNTLARLTGNVIRRFLDAAPFV
ncbi:MAG TPA: N,N-dimethylformamidase beta subunit family domain-containing protein [Acetobacteraceae bacterium]